jgi:hypothetical protein
VVTTTNAETLLNTSKSTNATVLPKRMLVLGYEVTYQYWFLRTYDYGTAVLQNRLFTVVASTIAAPALSSAALASGRIIANGQ